VHGTSIPFLAHVARLLNAGGLIFDKNIEMALLLKFNKYIQGVKKYKYIQSSLKKIGTMLGA